MIKQFRADFPAWIFVGGISFFPWIIVWATAAHGLDPVSLLIAVVVSAFSLTWLISFRIVITRTDLIFRSLFRGKQNIKHSEIKIIRLQWKLLRTRKGPLQLVVEPREKIETRTMSINAKVFSRAAIDAVLDLGARVAEADDNGLREGIVLKSLRSWKQNKNKK